MPRLLGVDIPSDKPTYISLTYLYGVGSGVSRDLCHKAGIDPQKHFGRTLFSGGHEQSVLGVLKGTLDSAFTWTSPGHQSGQFRIMMDRGILKLEDLRVVWESPLIANPLWAIPKSIPEDMKKDLLAFFEGLAKNDMAMAEAAAQGKTSGFEKVTHETYKTFVTIAEDQRKSRRN